MRARKPAEGRRKRLRSALGDCSRIRWPAEDQPLIEASGPDVEHQSKARIFISYSRKDMAFADRLEAALKARDFEPLIDRSEIYAFEEWWTRIENLIARADTVVFVLSPHSVKSDVALKEVAFAASLRKRFAPILCGAVDDKTVPEARERLAAADRSNAMWQHDLSISYNRVGDVLRSQDKLDEAL
jgi:hypothetical protein